MTAILFSGCASDKENLLETTQLGERVKQNWPKLREGQTIREVEALMGLDSRKFTAVYYRYTAKDGVGEGSVMSRYLNVARSESANEWGKIVGYTMKIDANEYWLSFMNGKLNWWKIT